MAGKLRVCQIMASANNARTAPITASLMRTRPSPAARRGETARLLGDADRLHDVAERLVARRHVLAEALRIAPHHAEATLRHEVAELLAVVDLLERRQEGVDHLL